MALPSASLVPGDNERSLFIPNEKLDPKTEDPKQSRERFAVASVRDIFVRIAPRCCSGSHNARGEP